MSPVLTIQRRMMQLGKVRLGEKGPKGEPRKRETFRFTSASSALLDAVAEKYGGTVRPWEGAPDEGYYEVGTDARELGIILPPVFSSADGSPTTSYSQWFELWSAAGCQRRCDGLTESLSGKDCLCQKKVDKDGEDARECKITTRVSFMLPDIPGLGVWVCESHGWNSAVELPGTLEVLTLAASENKFIPAVLRAEPRTKKQPGKPTKKFIVPVIDLPGVTVNQLAAGDVPLALNAPVARPDRPALPAGPAPPADPAFEHGAVAHGDAPPLPTDTVPAQDPSPNGNDALGEQTGTGGDSPIVNARQVKLLWTTIRGRGVPEDDVRRILREVTGQESTKQIPAELFDAVLTAVQAVEMESQFAAMVPESAKAANG